MRGKLIAVDGPSFSGKTTLVKHLQKFFEKSLMKVEVVRNVPKESEIGLLIHGHGQKFKRPAITNTLLIAASKHFEYHNTIKPLLDEGVHVLSDRSVLSSIALDYMYGQEDIELTYEIYASLPEPDTTLLLSAEVEVLKKRMLQRGALTWSKVQYTREQEVQSFMNATVFMEKKGKRFKRYDTSAWSAEHGAQVLFEYLEKNVLGDE